MKKPAINRYISDKEAFETIKTDFGFLVEKIKASGFEYDLQIRDGYFNLYYKGNSIGEISFKKSRQQYRIKIHEKFVNDKIKKRFNPALKNGYLVFNIPRNQLHPLYSSENLKSMTRMVKMVDFQEEIIYEQMLMTDNVNRDDLIIIDRQVKDRISSTKMDLLALQERKYNDYQFCIIEVKLGNNPELSGDVITQLKGYVKRIEDNFEDYKMCYEQNFAQKRELGLFIRPNNIKIVPGVLSVIVVMGYSGLANQSIKALKQKDPSIKVIQLSNKIDIKKLG